MQYSLHPPNRGRSLAIALTGALLGAGVATTTFALTDSDMASPSAMMVAGSAGEGSRAEPTRLYGQVP